MYAPICLVHREANEQSAEQLEVYRYKSKTYIRYYSSFDPCLNGTLGCSTAINLGFYLSYSILGVRTNNLHVLHIADRATREQHRSMNIPFDDERLVYFLRVNGFLHIPQ